MMRRIKELYFIGIGVGFFGYVVSCMVIAEIIIATADFLTPTKRK